MMRSDPLQTTDLHVIMTHHHTLLEHAMAEQLGPVAALITRALARNGPLTLRDVITAIQQDPFISAQLYQESCNCLLPREGVQGDGTATQTEPQRTPKGLFSSSSSPSPTAAVPVVNAMAASVRAARSTASNLFLDVSASPSSSSTSSTTNAAVIQALVHDASLLTDAAVKEAMSRLVLHRVVRHNASTRTYELMLGYGVLLRVLFPLVARLAHHRFGRAGEALVLALHRLGVVPSWSAALQLAQNDLRRPSAQVGNSSAAALATSKRDVSRAGVELLRAGWVQFLPLTDSLEVEAVQGRAVAAALAVCGGGMESSAPLAPSSSSSSRKRPRDDFDFDFDVGGGGGSHTTSAHPMKVSDGVFPCRLSLQTILGALFEDAVEKQMVQYYGSHLTMPSAVVGSLLQHSLPHARRHATHGAHSHPRALPTDAHTGDEEEVVLELFSNADDLAHASVRPGGFPPAPAPPRVPEAANTSDQRRLGQPMTLAEVANAVAQRLHARREDRSEEAVLSHEDEAALKRALHRLGEHTPAAVRSPLVTAVAATPGLASPPRYALVFGATSDALKATACESVIFARHGVLGVRLWKLLTMYRALEDRQLAEECMATQPRTREALHALMKDGYVAQREVPRNASQASIWSAERVPRNFVFLWTTNMAQQIVPTVREQVAQSLHNALTRIGVEFANLARQQAQNRSTGSAASVDSVQATLWSGAGPEMASALHGNEAAVEGRAVALDVANPHWAEALKSQRAVIGLQACALSLMQQLLVLDFF